MLNASVRPIKLCRFTNWCAVMPFFMLKIVGGVGSNFETVTFYTAADDFLWSYFVFFCSLEQYMTVTDCTGWHTCLLFMFKNWR